MSYDQIVYQLRDWQGKMPDEGQLYHALERDDPAAFYDELLAYEEEGRLIRTKKGGWALPWQLGYLAGRMQRHERGFGFLIQEDEDVFVPAGMMNGAMNGDTVLVRLSHKPRDKNKKEGSVERIIKRSRDTVVGIVETIPSGAFVVPDDKRCGMDIFVPKDKTQGAEAGQKVLVKITKWPEGQRSPTGKVEEILGNPGEVGVDILSIVRDMNLRDTFPKKVLQEADAITKEVPESAIEGRIDLRDQLVFTIDGADAKDLDDAISIEMIDNGNFKLGVHIADVSHYVKTGSELDEEGRKRATSVYLIDRVIPMLPEALSNGICSLHGGVTRLTLSCIMEINMKGDVVDFEVGDSVIKSCARLTYQEVNDIFDGDQETRDNRLEIVPSLELMYQLSQILRAKRERRGAIELDIDEPHIMLDAEGVPVSVKTRERGKSHKLIEEFMLCANETVAEYVYNLELPFMYRIHELPKEEKLREFARFSHNLGHTIKGSLEDVHPKALQALLDDVVGTAEEDVLHRVLLRTMQKARYSPINQGHFGLASDYYCHFTSPIRRYPDLIVHRVLKAITGGGEGVGYMKKLVSRIADLADHCSEQERSALTAERAVDDLKMTEYMSHHLGEVFEGIISGVTDFGMFVELPNTIEGLIRMTALQDDYYVFMEQGYLLQGRRTGKQYRLGDRVKVVCTKADVATRQIDFELADEDELAEDQ